MRSEYKLCINKKQHKGIALIGKNKNFSKSSGLDMPFYCNALLNIGIFYFCYIFIGINYIFKKQAKIIFSCDYMNNRTGMKVYTF